MARVHSMATTDEQRWLEEVRRIVVEALRPYRADVFLFGSRARGEQRNNSDIDVAVDPQADLPRIVLVRLREALEESHVPLHVDVVDLTESGEGFRERVRKEGTLWSSSNSA